MPSLSRIKWYAVLAIGLVFGLVGIEMIVDGAPHGWPAFLFFGVCGAVAVDQLWPDLLMRRAIPPDVLLSRFPGPIDLHVDRRKLLFLTIMLAIFGGVLFWLVYNVPFGAFAAILLWPGVIVCAALVALMIVSMIRGSSLRLDGEGLQIRRTFFRRHITRWADTSVFEVALLPVGDTKMIVFDDARTRNSMLGAINAGVAGRSAGLSGSYGLSHDEMAWLLNRWRERALTTSQ